MDTYLKHHIIFEYIYFRINIFYLKKNPSWWNVSTFHCFIFVFFKETTQHLWIFKTGFMGNLWMNISYSKDISNLCTNNLSQLSQPIKFHYLLFSFGGKQRCKDRGAGPVWPDKCCTPHAALGISLDLLPYMALIPGHM